MKIILKHILRNMRAKKGRTLLIIVALVIATTVFTLNLTLPKEIEIKYEQTLRSICGDTDVCISAVDSFSYEDIQSNNTKVTYVGTKSVQAEKGDDQIMIIGMNIDEVKKVKMLGEDVPDLKDNELAINKSGAICFSN